MKDKKIFLGVLSLLILLVIVNVIFAMPYLPPPPPAPDSVPYEIVINETDNSTVNDTEVNDTVIIITTGGGSGSSVERAPEVEVVFSRSADVEERYDVYDRLFIMIFVIGVIVVVFKKRW